MTSYEPDITLELPAVEYERQRGIEEGTYVGEIHLFTTGSASTGPYIKAQGRVYIDGEAREVGNLTLWMPEVPSDDTPRAKRMFHNNWADTQRFLGAMGLPKTGKVKLSELNTRVPIPVRLVLRKDKNNPQFVRIVDVQPIPEADFPFPPPGLPFAPPKIRPITADEIPF